MKKKVMVIFGTRPEATKMCTVVQELKKFPDRFDTRLVVTGQHREQLYQPLEHFGLKPDIDLALMRDKQTLAYITSSAIAGLDDVMAAEKPDLVLVHGDTQTSMCGAMAAFFHHIPVGHVEAGLRSFNKYSPWPEEVNRRVVDVIAELLFAPTERNRTNLLAENLSGGRIHVTGQTAVDAALRTRRDDYIFKSEGLNAARAWKGRVIYVTAHRRENYGEPMHRMFTAMRRVVDAVPDVLMVYPMHLSPTVREAARPILSGHDRILLLDPIEFADSINLQALSHVILSDSGGLQEESTVFHKPMVLMRDTTERPEAVEAGAVFLSGTDGKVIFDVTMKLLTDPAFYANMAGAKNPFGDGRASERIVGIIANHFGFEPELPEEFR
jgi:UDP-N-acetylglucosamine 2-epimerase (non-hydrolysing)